MVLERSGGAIVVRPWGELDMATAPLLWEVLARVLDREEEVVIDLSGVGFADCAGLRVIRQARLARPHGLEVSDAQPAVQRTLDLTSLSSSSA